MCIDAHMIGKNTLSGFRSLFTFTETLLMTMSNDDALLNASYFEDFETF